MLVKFTGDQIARHWKVIRYAISEALPPIAHGAENRMERILSALLADQMHCWVVYETDGTLIGIMTTTISGDPASGMKNLMIYSLWGIDISRRAFADGLITLRRFAESKGCNRIISYTNEPSIIALVERLRSSETYRFISVPVK